MRKSAGFTLIELVIVIIILGILGAVAAPRLFNLQGDAYGANLNALRSSISSAATMANAKAQLAGEGMGDAPTDAKGTKVEDYDENVLFKFGYPIADSEKGDANTGILATLDGFDYNRYAFPNKLDVDDASELENSLIIVPESIQGKAIRDTKKGCVVIYTEPSKAGESAKVEAFTGGC